MFEQCTTNGVSGIVYVCVSASTRVHECVLEVVLGCTVYVHVRMPSLPVVLWETKGPHCLTLAPQLMVEKVLTVSDHV